MKEFTDTELKNEQWRDIDGYDGMYQVSDLGRVRSKKYGDWRVFRPNKNKYGYLYVGLSKENKRKHFYVHRLVASAFIPNDNIFNTEINHIDECKQNNKVSNLEYCDRSYNLRYNDLNYRRITKIDRIKDLYNPNLTYEQNLEIFKANGIECGEQTVFNLRRDLKLIQPHPKYKRDKVKDLYNPNLTYEQNLEMFMANGIECARQTIYNLRKDLGLTKKYKV